LIHCSLAHSGAWRGMRAKLADRASTVAFDLPGHGQSADWTGEGDYQDVAVALAEGLIAAEMRVPLDLIGHSFGGTIALRLAQRHPEHVRSLTMIEPVLFAAARAHPLFEQNNAFMKGAFAHAIRAGDRMEAARIFNTLWGAEADWGKLPQSMREDMARRIHLIAAGRSVTQEDLHGQAAPGALEALDMPVLLIEGARSQPLIRTVHDAFEARLPQVRRVVIEGAGHMAPVSHPKDVARAVEEFFDTCAPA